MYVFLFLSWHSSYDTVSFSSDNGTIDYTTYLSVHVALQWREWVGGEAAIHQYCNNLAKNGGALLAQTMNTKVMDPNGEFTMAMVSHCSRSWHIRN